MPEDHDNHRWVEIHPLLRKRCEVCGQREALWLGDGCPGEGAAQRIPSTPMYIDEIEAEEVTMGTGGPLYFEGEDNDA